jgi:hypothetical protein
MKLTYEIKVSIVAALSLFCLVVMGLNSMTIQDRCGDNIEITI